MKKITSLAVSFLLVSGCSQSLQNTKFDNQIETSLPQKIDTTPKERTVSVVDLVNGVYVAHGESVPFTGKQVHFSWGGGRIEHYFLNGQHSGTTTAWYGNGKKEGEWSFKNGKIDGIRTDWYENGIKKSEQNYQNGKQEGIYTKWYENGQKSSEANYKDDVLDGLNTTWHENGQKNSEVNYRAGKREGLQIVWFKNGQKNSESHYKNDKANGLYTVFYENDQKKSEEIYKDGNKVKVVGLFDENGNKQKSELMSAHVKTSTSPCDDISDLALQIMRGRQNGTAMSKMMQIAEDNKLMQAMVIAAYEKNRYSTEEVQTKIIEEFRDDAHLQCVKALRR